MKKILFSLTLSFSVISAAQNASQAPDHAEYREGYSYVLAQSWVEAQNHFTEFAKNWPDSVWADDADFWNCYSIEQEKNNVELNFDCYSSFIGNWPTSSWVADASSKLAVLGANLAALGFPEYIDRVSSEWDFEFEFIADDISDSIEAAMEQAELELERYEAERERMSLQGIEMPPAPPLPNIGVDTDVEVEFFSFNARDIRLQAERAMRRFNRDQRSSADDELLTVMAALRDNERAAELLVARLRSSDNPVMRSRIVMLLEDVEGDEVTSALVGVIENDDSNEVKANAVLVLLDRDETSVRDLLLNLVQDPEFPVVARIEIIGNMEDWDDEIAVPALAELLNGESELAFISEAARSLASIGTEEATQALFNAINQSDNLYAKREIIRELGDIESPQVMTYLTDVALNELDDETASSAIASIAERSDNIALAALEHIYMNTENQQRRYASLEGIGEVESEQSVEVLGQIYSAATNPLLQSAAIRALGDTQIESAVDIIKSAYNETDNEDIRRSSVRALRRLDEFPSATDAMLEILELRLDEEI